MIVAFVPDLMDRSKVAAAAAAARPTFVARAADLAGIEASLVIVDLTRPGVIDVLPSIRGRVIGFANHTARDLMAQARAAGCDEVMPRSDFFGRLDEWVVDPAGP